MPLGRRQQQVAVGLTQGGRTADVGGFAGEKAGGEGVAIWPAGVLIDGAGGSGGAGIVWTDLAYGQAAVRLAFGRFGVGGNARSALVQTDHRVQLVIGLTSWRLFSDTSTAVVDISGLAVDRRAAEGRGELVVAAVLSSRGPGCGGRLRGPWPCA